MVTDIALINKILKGEQTAFKTLVDRYQDYVFTICQRILPSREEAEEAAQDTFVKAYSTLKSFRKESKFSTWLYTIAYRTAIDEARKKHLPIQSLDAEDSFLQISDVMDHTPDKRAQNKDLREQLKAAINHLKPEEGTIITLYYLHEKSVKEIADITGLSVSNIKVRLFRIRERLKTHLNKRLKEEIQELL